MVFRIILEGRCLKCSFVCISTYPVWPSLSFVNPKCYLFIFFEATKHNTTFCTQNFPKRTMCHTISPLDVMYSTRNQRPARPQQASRVASNKPPLSKHNTTVAVLWTMSSDIVQNIAARSCFLIFLRCCYALM